MSIKSTDEQPKGGNLLGWAMLITAIAIMETSVSSSVISSKVVNRLLDQGSNVQEAKSVVVKETKYLQQYDEQQQLKSFLCAETQSSGVDQHSIDNSVTFKLVGDHNLAQNITCTLLVPNGSQDETVAISPNN